MSAIVDTLPSPSTLAFILGLLLVYYSMMDFFLGCAGCRQSKPRGATDRRPPPPTPELPDFQRYQSDPSLHEPEPSDGYSVPMKKPPNAVSHNTRTLQSSAASQKQTRAGGAPPCDYENVLEGLAPVIRKDHTYLEVFPSDTELPPASSDQGKAIRSSVESTGGPPSLTDSLCNSYENVSKSKRRSEASAGRESALSEGVYHTYVNESPASTASILEADYVNMTDNSPS